jgi:tetratricopeptide (TPR) repeat protein
LKTTEDVHLSLREMEAAASGRLAAARLAHLEKCEVCSDTVRDLSEIANALPRDAAGSLEPVGTCPGTDELALWMAGELDAAAAERVMTHAAECGRCAAIVRGAMEEEAAAVTVMPVRRERPAAQRWIALAASVLIAVGALLWWREQANQPQRLLASAYTQMRPFEFRLADAGYGPVRQQRGGGGSALEHPPELFEAESALKSAPPTTEVFALRGRAELLENQVELAIQDLTRAQETGSQDPAVAADLGCAYALRGDAEGRAIDHGRALELLLQAVKTRPNEPRFLFNLALVYERLSRTEEALAAWRNYLKLDASGPWADEARRRLSDLETRRK